MKILIVTGTNFPCVYREQNIIERTDIPGLPYLLLAFVTRDKCLEFALLLRQLLRLICIADSRNEVSQARAVRNVDLTRTNYINLLPVH